MVNVTTAELMLTASLKAAQIAADLLLIQSTCATIVTRVLLQNALKSFYQGNVTSENFNSAYADVAGALASGGFSSLLQAAVFPRNTTGESLYNTTGIPGILHATANATGIMLPTTYPNGTHAMLGDETSLGFPTALYPNITYVVTNRTDPMDPTMNQTIAYAVSSDYPLNQTAALVLGPVQINQTYALISYTLAIVDTSNHRNVLGFMTVVAAASSLIGVVQSREGLASTGIVLIAGPSRKENKFAYSQRPANKTYTPDLSVLGMANTRFVFPPYPPSGVADRHSTYNQNLSLYGSSNFSMSRFPAIEAGFGTSTSALNYQGASLSTHNENNVTIAVGYARPATTIVDWLLIIEQSHSEAWAPITRLRNIVLACVFGTLGLIIIVVLPMAHFSVRPIRRLRDATEKSVSPPGYTPNGSIRSDRDGEASGDEIGELERSDSNRSKKRGIFVRLRNMRKNGTRKTKSEQSEDNRRREFKIPGKVQDRKHLITDELTELTTTFNEMSDELMSQYEILERKVAERTHQLEISKKAAEAANESKTLFIANISHELKTPLNGILGMCAVCMGEDDLPRIKRSLQIVYKSGDLLLHLLNDLLTFSKNQIGQQLSLEQKEFRLLDIRTQVLTIFTKQVAEGKINFTVKFINEEEQEITNFTEKRYTPGRLKDMSLWGDQHRILQVIINLVSNSLKFTPEGGKVEVRIRCLGEVETPISDGSRNSMGSKQSSQRTSRQRHRNDSGSNNSQMSRKPSDGNKHHAGTALLINPMDPKATPRVQVRERTPTPPPIGAKTLMFQFEVEDTGAGIPENLRDRVFEPFVQGDLGLNKKFGGTGLGLSICSQLATLMGGEITLESNVGVGTIFNMKIPLKHVKSRAPSTSSSEMVGSRPSSPKLLSPKVSGEGASPDAQPRLVGLSQPFFAAPPSPAAGTGKDPHDQIAALDGVAADKEPGSKLRVLVAEDNLVNQEVVLR